MLDRRGRRLVDPALAWLARRAVDRGLSADGVTALAFVAGLGCAVATALGAFGLALAALALGRILDGLDGAVARLTRSTDRGGFLDIVGDFVFYGAVPLAFAWRDPAANALPAAVLLFSFYVNGASVLAYAALAAKRPVPETGGHVRALHLSAGLAEGTETILVFALMLAVPAWFPGLAWGFAVVCLLTAAARARLAWTRFPPDLPPGTG